MAWSGAYTLRAGFIGPVAPRPDLRLGNRSSAIHTPTQSKVAIKVSISCLCP